MSRSTQFIGLNDKAYKFVETLEKVKNTDNKTEGMFDEEIPLGVWRDEAGDYIFEVVQMEPWSSGPMIFTCLEKNGKKMFKWEVVKPKEPAFEFVDHETGRCHF